MARALWLLIACLALFLLSVFPFLGRAHAIEPESQERAARFQTSPTSTLYLPVIAKNYIPPNPLWRFGIAKARRSITEYGYGDIRLMRFGWYVDWGASADAYPLYGMEYVPMIRVKQLKQGVSGPTSEPCWNCPYVTPYTYTASLTPAQIQSRVSSRPGATWVIGNEIERRDWGTGPGKGQDEIVPELYAVAYHELYAVIKQADPSAQVAIGGVIQATPLRLEYLRRVWDEHDRLYGGGATNTMPVNLWNVHAFVLNERSCSAYPLDCWGAGIPAGLNDTSGMVISPEQNKNFSIAAGHLTALRTWMAQRGQRSKPLYITEYGVNIPPEWGYSPNYYPFTFEQVRDSFMYPSFNWLRTATSATTGMPADGNRLVQRWNWYSLDDDRIDPGTGQQAFNGNLFWSGLEAAHPMGVSALGTYWSQYVQPLPAGASKPY